MLSSFLLLVLTAVPLKQRREYLMWECPDTSEQWSEAQYRSEGCFNRFCWLFSGFLFKHWTASELFYLHLVTIIYILIMISSQTAIRFLLAPNAFVIIREDNLGWSSDHYSRISKLSEDLQLLWENGRVLLL